MIRRSGAGVFLTLLTLMSRIRESVTAHRHPLFAILHFASCIGTE